MKSILCGGRPEGLLKPGGPSTHSREHQTGLQVRLQENIIRDFSHFLSANLWYTQLVTHHLAECQLSCFHTIFLRQKIEAGQHKRHRIV